MTTPNNAYKEMISKLLTEVDKEIEDRKHSGCYEDYAPLEQLSDQAHALISSNNISAHEVSPQPFQVAYIELTSFGSDVAVFLNGEYISSADPSDGGDAQSIRALAGNLAAFYQTDVTEIPVEGYEDWQWTDIESKLKADGKLFCIPV